LLGRKSERFVDGLLGFLELPARPPDIGRAELRQGIFRIDLVGSGKRLLCFVDLVEAHVGVAPENQDQRFDLGCAVAIGDLVEDFLVLVLKEIGTAQIDQDVFGGRAELARRPQFLLARRSVANAEVELARKQARIDVVRVALQRVLQLHDCRSNVALLNLIAGVFQVFSRFRRIRCCGRRSGPGNGGQHQHGGPCSCAGQ